MINNLKWRNVVFSKKYSTSKGFNYTEWQDKLHENKQIKKANALQEIFKNEANSALMNIYFNEPFENYQFNQSSLYTRAFELKLKEALGCPKAFKRTNKKSRIAKANKINQLFNLEDKFKTTLRRSIHNNKLLDGTFKAEKKDFKKWFTQMVIEQDSRANVNKKFFRSKLYNALGTLLLDLVDEKILPAFLEKIYFEDGFEDDLMDRILEIQNTLFNDIIKVFLDRAYQNIFNYEIEERLSEFNSFLVVKKTDLVHTLVVELMKSLFIVLCSVIQETNGMTSRRLDSIESSFLNYITRHNKRLYDKCYYDEFIMVTHQIIDVFIVSTDQKIVKLKPKGKKHLEIYLTLDFKAENTYPYSLHLPELTPPSDWTAEGLCPTSHQTLVRSLHFGDSIVNYDKNTINAINLTQQKPFTINDDFLNILLEVDKLEDVELDLPFPTFHQMVAQKDKVEKLAKVILKKADVEMYHFILNSERRLEDFDFKTTKPMIMKLLGLSNLDFELNNFYKKELRKLKTMNNKRQIFLTIKFIAQIYSGFPIYYKNFACYRLRWYPWNWLMSRSTGFYKYLLKDAKKIKLTNKGLFSVMQAYFHQDNSLFLKLNACFTTDNLTKKGLMSFFKSNKISYYKKNPLYFRLLEHDLKSVARGKTYVSALVEIDQKTSCAVFMSLLLKNKHLALFSNLLGGESVDLNEYLQKNTKDFFVKQGYNSPRVLEFFEKHREGQKKAFMSWCYSQQAMGRAETWVLQFETLYGDLTRDEKSVLYKFAHKYPAFLNEFFPGLIDQLSALVNIFDFFLKETKRTKLKTLDGSIVYWQFNAQSDGFARYYNFIQKKRISIRIAKAIEGSIDYKKSHRTFLAGVIHAIDGSFMRLLVLKFNERNPNVILNPNHDSIQVHPNYVEELYFNIAELYTDDTFNNLAEKMLFEPMFTEIPNSKVEQFQKLVQKFNDLKQDFVIDKNQIKIKNLYRYE